MTLAFLDECGFSPSQPVNYSWTPAGQRKHVPYENPEGRRVDVLAAMVADGPTPSLTCASVPRSLTADDLVLFLREAIPRGAGLLVVVLDIAAIHRSRVVRAARQALRAEGIVLYYPPTCSPELNAIEPVFGVVKHHDLPERAHQTVAALGDAVDAAFAAAEKRLVSKSAQELRPAA
ncbi:MAG: transposase [Chloroflexi bacterium]|nr:transposase [Chloroflexota bacterium]